jgi:DNA-binding NtrC family response regulator
MTTSCTSARRGTPLVGANRFPVRSLAAGGAPSAPGLPVAQKTGVRQRILLVDDQRPILLAVSEYFRRHGYDVDCAQRREEAEVLLVAGRYACVISDLRLTAQGADGLDLARASRERCPGTRFVILTAHGTQAAEDEARQRGVDAFLHKPLALAHVARIVERLLEETA